MPLPPRNKPQPRARGQVLVLLALGFVAFLGFVALSIDGGMILSARRRAQAAADSAALAAAYAKVSCRTDWQSVAWEVAEQNGFSADAGDVINVTCEQADGGVCASVCVGAEEEHIRVAITTQRQTAFAQLIFSDTLETKVEAVARARQESLVGHDIFVSLNPTGSPWTGEGGIMVNNGATVNLTGGGMFSNSNNDPSVASGASVVVNLDSGSAVRAVGTIDLKPYPACDWCIENAQPIDVPELVTKFHKLIPPIPTPPPCTTTVDSLVMKSGGTLSSGVYCVSSGEVWLRDVTMTGHVTIIADPTAPGDITIESSTADSLVIYNRTGTVAFKDSFSADRLRVYSSGDANVVIRYGATMTVDDTLFYLTNGQLDWNDSTSVQICAPPSDDPDGFAGLAIYMVNSSGYVNFHGASNNWVVGTILAPYATVDYHGGSSSDITIACHTHDSNPANDLYAYDDVPAQVVGGTILFHSGTNVYADFDPRFFYTTTVIEMLK